MTVIWMLWLVIGFVAALACLAIAVIALRRNRARIGAHVAQREFWLQTGYAHTSLFGAPLATQLAYPATSARDYTAQLPNGAVVRYQAQTHKLGAHRVTAAAWTLTPAELMVGGWQIVSKSRMSAAGSGWVPLYGPTGPVGNAEFDQRFTVFARVPSHAKLLLSDRIVQRQLLQFAEVDLIASATQLAFFDPHSKNLEVATLRRKRRAHGVDHQVAVHLQVRDTLMLLAQLERSHTRQPIMRQPGLRQSRRVRYDC